MKPIETQVSITGVMMQSSGDDEAAGKINTCSAHANLCGESISATGIMTPRVACAMDHTDGTSGRTLPAWLAASKVTPDAPQNMTPLYVALSLTLAGESRRRKIVLSGLRILSVSYLLCNVFACRWTQTIQFTCVYQPQRRARITTDCSFNSQNQSK